MHVVRTLQNGHVRLDQAFPDPNDFCGCATIVRQLQVAQSLPPNIHKLIKHPFFRDILLAQWPYILQLRALVKYGFDGIHKALVLRAQKAREGVKQ